MKKRILKRKNSIKFIAFAATFAMLLTACGEITEETPELLEPVSTNEAYRPVEYGDVGTNIIKTGYVVPTDYCYFFNTSATLSKVYVNVGDYVEEGDVLAEADSDESSTSIDELKASLTNLQETHNITTKIYEMTQKEYDYKIKACEEVGDSEGASEYKTEKAVEAENNRYDTMLYEYQVKKLNEQIEEQEELQTSNTLVADHSGYVTYTRALVTSDGEDNSSVTAADNIVVISDYDDIYIELTGEEVKKDGYSAYNIMYTVVSGQRYDLEEFGYTNQELAVAQSMGSLPYARFNISGGDNSILTVGTSVPLYFSTSTSGNVLIVGNDSLYQEGEQYFVYVKGDDEEKVKRNITIGKSDDNYTEVVSGLSEGELVYYESDAIVPGNYTTYTVTLEDYEVMGYIKNENYSLEDTNQVIYTAPASGYFETFELTEGKVVEKGDLLFTVDSGGGSAELIEINSEISSAKEDYDATVSDYNDQISELREEIEYYKSTENVATPGDADYENTLYMEEQLTCEIEIAKYNKELALIEYNSTVNPLIAQRDKLNENNDGNGNISVYAESGGTVLSIYASASYELEEGQKILSIGTDENQAVLVKPVDSENTSDSTYITMTLGQEVTLVDQSDSTRPTMTAKIIGTTGDYSKIYVTNRDDEVYITRSSNYCNADHEYYYIEPEDESFYDNSVGYNIKCTKSAFNSIVVIPKALAYQETDKTSGKEYYYVWKIVDDEMVKQYITISEDVTTTLSYCVLSGLSEGDLLAKEKAD